MCRHAGAADVAADEAVVPAATKDSAGNVLADGGAGGGVVKVGTRVRGIRLITDGVGDHDIDATVPGFGRTQLESSAVRRGPPEAVRNSGRTHTASSSYSTRARKTRTASQIPMTRTRPPNTP